MAAQNDAARRWNLGLTMDDIDKDAIGISKTNPIFVGSKELVFNNTISKCVIPIQVNNTINNLLLGYNIHRVIFDTVCNTVLQNIGNIDGYVNNMPLPYGYRPYSDNQPPEYVNRIITPSHYFDSAVGGSGERFNLALRMWLSRNYPQPQNQSNEHTINLYDIGIVGIPDSTVTIQ